MNFVDAVQLGDVRATAEGYMVADVKVARTGIQLYRGSEVGKPDKELVRLYRPEEEVFAIDAMSSFAHKPVTVGHPDKLVTPKTWKRDSVGFTSGDIARDGGFLRVPMMVADAKAIQAVRDGHRELSAGYTCDIDWTAGSTPEGEPFDGRQIAIRSNHIAIVSAGRAGHACRIGDGWPNDEPLLTDEDDGMPEQALRTVTVDGLSISVTDQGAQIIDRLQRQISDMTVSAGRRDAEVTALRDAHAGELTAVRSEHQRLLDAKAGEVAALASQHAGTVDALKVDHQKALDALSGEVSALKAQQPTAEQMDALIADRAKIIDASRKILGDKFDPKGKSNAALRREAVSKRLGATAVADKSDDYIQAAFDTLTAVGAGSPPGRDPVVDHFTAQQMNPNPNPHFSSQSMRDADDAHASYVEKLKNGWKLSSVTE